MYLRQRAQMDMPVGIGIYFIVFHLHFIAFDFLLQRGYIHLRLYPHVGLQTAVEAIISGRREKQIIEFQLRVGGIVFHHAHDGKDGFAISLVQLAHTIGTAEKMQGHTFGKDHRLPVIGIAFISAAYQLAGKEIEKRRIDLQTHP